MKTKGFIRYKTALKAGSLFVIMILTMIACRKDIEVTKSDPYQSNLKSMTEMKVSTDFTWKTFQDVQVQLTGNAKAAVFIKSSTGVVYEKALLLPQVTYQTIIAIPTYETELTVAYNGVSHIIKIIDKKISYSF